MGGALRGGLYQRWLRGENIRESPPLTHPTDSTSPPDSRFPIPDSRLLENILPLL
ncbi:hypothetical protein [Moorena sp. SIO4G3]|uniref:hypothetical protein n=1 Tax=Moorena sp. SIO4G3 TaxID=2607821 RepID=UPI0014295DD8|nr:hypothetical protein [Moorena sp. SIO4G3]NEO78019.1 hypothetical protein [Moorena sp. SIO4G3]